jgi:hypothetical protein
MTKKKRTPERVACCFSWLTTCATQSTPPSATEAGSCPSPHSSSQDVSSVWSLGAFDHSSLRRLPRLTTVSVFSLLSPSPPLFFQFNQLHHYNLFAKGPIEDTSFEQNTQLPRHCLLEPHRAPNLSCHHRCGFNTVPSNKAVSKVSRPHTPWQDMASSNKSRHPWPIQASLSRTMTIN